jgi:hypothetical protein
LAKIKFKNKEMNLVTKNKNCFLGIVEKLILLMENKENASGE